MHQEHPHKESHRRPRLSRLGIRPSASDGRLHRTYTAQAGGAAVTQGGAPGHRAGLRHPQPRTQSEGVEVEPAKCRQTVKTDTNRTVENYLDAARHLPMPYLLSPIMNSLGIVQFNVWDPGLEIHRSGDPQRL